MDPKTQPTFSRVLKAAAVLADADTDTLALRSRILRSRVVRILSGTLAPNGEESARLLSAAGCDPALLTEHVLSGGSHTVMAALLAGSRRTQVVDGVVLPAARLTIDKMAIVFDAVDGRRLVETAQRYGLPAKRKLYQVAFYGHGVWLEHAPTDENPQIRRSSRVEFNPDRALGRHNRDPHAAAFITSIARLLKPDGAEITQIDVAVDLPVSISDVQALAERRQKFQLWIGPDGIESIYSGTSRSAFQIVTYDKHRERVEKGLSTLAAGPLTRIEACVQRPGLALLDLPALPNPYRDLRLFLLRPDGLPLARRLLVEYARFAGLPALRAELAPDDFKELCRDLEQSDAAPIVPHPRVVFDAKWDRVSRSLLAALRLGGTP